MNAILSRRALIGAGFALPMLALPGCTTAFGGFSYDKAIRRLLALSAQRAFERLLSADGFFADPVVQVTLPPELGGTGGTALLAALLRSEEVQARLLRQLNKAAETAAETAAPLVLDAIRTMRIADQAAVVRGGSMAAAEWLQGAMGDAVFAALLPGVDGALRLDDGAIVTQALQAATGIDFERLRADVARKASDGIYRAIGREEAAIRADPAATGDELLRVVFGILR